MDREKTKKIIIIVSGVAFLGSSITGLIGLISSSFQDAAQGNNNNAAQSQNAQLLAQEKGYISVLQREPKNPTAIQGLSQIINAKAQTGDLQGARTTIAALVKIDPTNKDYQAALTQIDKDIAKTQTGKKTPSPSATTAPAQPTKTQK